MVVVLRHRIELSGRDRNERRDLDASHWLSNDKGYHRLLHFFRAQSYDLDSLCCCWHRFVLVRVPLVDVLGRLVVSADHTHVVKDGGRMTGVVSLREISETQSKPNYFRGQCWAAIGVLAGLLSACFCLPLTLRIDQGFQHLGIADPDDSMTIRIVRMARGGGR